ncbi:hypothetical protein SETIT_6G142300v2 [Setaria italica]|uniref:Major facilitator superfamily (MFS) profile domain-containing protein n=3 Tax=Setaria italica TaxID=4555 RepID=A0A368RLH0_SETIT|nr:hypothetical protein SETIT_6G142300v2 [Setaria italica]
MGADAAGRRTLLMVNLASIMERADEAPRGSGPSRCAAPPCRPPATRSPPTLSRATTAPVVPACAFLWAAANFLVAVSDSFAQVAVARGMNGIGLALVTPAIQSLVADYTDDKTRGSAFGWLQLTGNLGSLIGGLFAIMLASTTFMGIASWRIAFHAVALISVIVGILVRLYAEDPHFRNDLVIDAKAVIKIPSFHIIVAQGITGSFPWCALSFAPMWLELMGFTHTGTGILMITFAAASSLGGRSPNSGRIILSQINSASAVPLAALLLLGLPDDPSTGFLHGFVIFIVGLSISWNAPATNNPIFAEIVPERSMTSIYALDRSFESVFAAFAPLVVGYLAEHAYGYSPALYAAIAGPMLLYCFIYSLLYQTYPRDRERARMEDTLISSELQRIELERSQGSREYFLGEDVAVIDAECGKELLDADDNEETTCFMKLDKGGLPNDCEPTEGDNQPNELV